MRFVDFRNGTLGEVSPTLQAKGTGGISLNYLPGVVTWVKARNAMTPDDYETWEERGVGRTLNAFENANDGRATILITYPIQDGRGMEKKQNGFGVGTEDDPSYTIDATGGQSVVVATIPIQSTVIGRSDVAGPHGPGHGDENSPMFTVDTVGPHAVAMEQQPLAAEEEESDESVVSFYSTGGSQQGFAQEGHLSVTLKVGSGLNIASPPAVALPDLVVRRLTPVECERLQGLPDDHTRWKVDEKTGLTVEQSDSARYKQCGNGLAVPVLSWIIEGILALEKEERETDESETDGPPGH